MRVKKARVDRLYVPFTISSYLEEGYMGTSEEEAPPYTILELRDIGAPEKRRESLQELPSLLNFIGG